MYGVFTVALLIQGIAIILWMIERVAKRSISELFGFSMPPDESEGGKVEVSAQHVAVETPKRTPNGNSFSNPALPGSMGQGWNHGEHAWTRKGGG